MKATQETAPRAIQAKSFLFLRPPVNLQKWDRNRIHEHLSRWAERQGITTSETSGLVLEALASDYRRLIMADNALINLYQEEKPAADAVAKLAAVVDKAEARIRKSWELLGVYPLVRKDATPVRGVASKVVNLRRPSTTAAA